MKKLGTFESDPPSVEGSGGVSAEGDTALVFLPFLPVVVLDGGSVEDGLPWACMTVVRGCERCVRTSGAGTVVVVDSPVEVVGGGGVAVVLVLVLVGAGSAAGGAGTFVVVAAAGAVASAVGAVEVVSASAASTGTSTASVASSGSRSAVSGGLVLIVSCRAGS